MNFKKFFIRFGFVSLAATLFAATGTYFKTNNTPVSAAVMESVTFTEDFSDKDTSAVWAKNDFSFAEDSYYSLRIDQHSTYGGIIAYKNYQVDGNCEIRFDLRYTETKSSASGDWFGVMFGLTEESTHFVYSTAVVNCKKTLVQLMDDDDGKLGKIKATSYDDHPKFADSFVGAAAKEKITVSLHLTPTGTRASDGVNLYRIDGYHYAVGGNKPSKPQFHYENVACDGWFGFSGMSQSVIDVSNLQIFEGEQLMAEENFKDENGNGIRFVGANADDAWGAVSYAEAKLYSYYNGGLCAGKANGVLLSKYAIKTDSRCKRTFLFTMQAKVEKLPLGSAFGVSFGLNDSASAMTDGGFIGLQGEGDGQFSIVYKKSGEQIAKTDVLPLTLITGEDGVVLQLEGAYDGGLTVNVNGYAAELEEVSADGQFAVGVCGSAAPEVYFDDIRIVESEYAVSSAADKAIDFSGLKEFYDAEEDFTYVERYINEREWFIGANVSLPKIYRKKDKYIQFVNSSTASFFGPKAIYSEFICRFTFTVIQNANDAAENTSIGLSFGKEARNDAATNCTTVAFAKTSGGMIMKGYNCSLVGGDASNSWKQYETYPEMNFWSSENWEKSPVTYWVMIVVRGGNAYVYYANAESAASEMSVCRAVFTDMQTYGCVTLSAWNGASFRLLDFAITNIAA